MQQLLSRDKILSSKLSRSSEGRFAHVCLWVCARSGDSWLWLLIIVFLILRGYGIGWRLLFAMLLTAVIVFISKAIIKRERPRESNFAVSADKYAFPSGHAARAGAMAVTVAFAYPHLIWVCLLWAMVVSIARVALSRHYISDVLGGLTVGITVGYLLHFAF